MSDFLRPSPKLYPGFSTLRPLGFPITTLKLDIGDPIIYALCICQSCSTQYYLTKVDPTIMPLEEFLSQWYNLNLHDDIVEYHPPNGSSIDLCEVFWKIQSFPKSVFPNTTDPTFSLKFIIIEQKKFQSFDVCLKCSKSSFIHIYPALNQIFDLTRLFLVTQS